MEGDRPGDAEHEHEHVGGPVEPGATPAADAPLGMGPPADVPGGFGSETVVEQRGWFSGARLTALITAVVLVIAGAAVAVVLSGGDDAQLEEVVPAGALAFGKVNLIPPGDQADALRQVIERFPIPDGSSVGDAFERFLDQALGPTGMSFARDVEPWLGTQVGFVVSEIQVAAEGPQARWALLAAVRNEAAAKSALDRVKQTEPSMAYAIHDGVAFIAPELLSLERVQGAVEGQTGPLSEDPDFSATVARVGQDVLGMVYLDGEQLQSLIPPGAIPSLPGVPSTAGKQIVALRAEPNRMVLEGFSTGPATAGATGTPALVEGAPQDLTGAVTLFDPATVVEQGLELAGLFLFGVQQGLDGGFSGGFGEPTVVGQQAPDARDALDEYLRETLGLSLDDDIFPWMHGELSVVVGRLALTQPEVGILIESTDDAAAGRTVDALRDNLGRIGRDAGFEVTAAEGGFAVTLADFPVSVIVRRVAGKVVIATGDQYAAQLLAASPQALAGDTVYRQAVGEAGADGVAFQMFVRIDRIASFIRAFVPPEGYNDAEPYLGPMQAFGIRATSTSDGSSFRMVLTFND